MSKKKKREKKREEEEEERERERERENMSESILFVTGFCPLNMVSSIVSRSATFTA